MSYEPIKGRVASRMVMVNAANELEVKAVTGTFSSAVVLADAPELNAPTVTGLLTGATADFSGTVEVGNATANEHAMNRITADGRYVNFDGDTMTGFLTLHADPTSAMHAATKQYVDSIATGLDVKESVRAATTAALPAVTYNNGAGTLTADANGALAAIDGITLVLNDRLLVKDQVAGIQNGIYVVTQVGDGSNPFILTRSVDADNSPAGEVTAGMFTFVEEGTVNGDNGFSLTTNDPITLGTSVLVFTQFSGAGSIIAGNGLTQTGNQIDVVGTAGRISVGANSVDIDSGYVGQTSITTLGTVTTGVWQGTVVGDAYITSALTGKTYNALTLTAQAVGFTIAGGTTSKTLTVSDNATVSGTNTGDQTITLTGDVTGSGTGSFATTIANDAVTTAKILNSNVTLAKIANIADQTILGNNSGGAAAPIALTAAQTKTVLSLDNVENTALSTWAGSTNLVTLGTVTTGVWNGTTIAIANGGTGATTASAAFDALAPTTTAGDLIYRNGSTNTRLAAGTANQVLGMNNAATAPEYKSVLGTANQITVVHGAGSITLSLPQDIHSGATPTFAQVILGTPSAANHAATKGYVDGLVQGLDFKASVRVASTADIDLTTGGLLTIDGVTLVAGNRVLVKNQSAPAENGIYIVAAGTWTRSEDANISAEVTAGMFTFVEEGSTNADTGWVLSTNDTITLGTTALSFTQFSSAGLVDGQNLGAGAEVFSAKVGNFLQFRSLVAGSSKLSVTENTNDISFDVVEANLTLNNIGGTLAANKGGTGFSTYVVGDMLYADSTTTVAKLAIGTANHVLTSTGSAPSWSNTLSLATLTLSGNLTLSGVTASRLLVIDGSNVVGANAALTANGAVYATGSGALASTGAMTNGQLLVGSTGNPPVAATLTGTSDQVVVTNGAGSITLSLPQNIATTSSPTFVNESLTGYLNMSEIAAPGLSASDQGRIYFDSTANKFKVSENGGAYIDLVSATSISGTLTSGYIPLANGTQSLTDSVVSQSGSVVTVTGSLVVTTTISASDKITGSGFVQAMSKKTADYTMLNNDHTILVSCSSADITITLPTAPVNGQMVVIKKVDATAFDMIIASSAGIDGNSTYTVSSQYAAVALQYSSDDSEWYIV